MSAMDSNAAAAMSTAVADTAARARTVDEYLTFRIGAEEYGIDILRVQEIRGYEPPTRIANAAEFIKGVVNLRGVIVPIVDLRTTLGIGDPTYDAFTIVIILNVVNRVVGVVVDSVSDVLELKAEEIRPAPAFNSMFDSSCITGLGTVGASGDVPERMLILMDIEQLMKDPGMGLIGA